jgi:hypothetical protein
MAGSGLSNSAGVLNSLFVWLKSTPESFLPSFSGRCSASKSAADSCGAVSNSTAAFAGLCKGSA